MSEEIEAETTEPAWRRSWPPMSYWVRWTLTVALTVALLRAADQVSNILIMVVIAFVIAVGLDPAVRMLEGLGIRRGLAVAVIFFALVLVAVGFAMLVGPPLVRQIGDLSRDIPTYFEKLASRQDSIGQYIRDRDLVKGVQDFIAAIPKNVAKSFDTVLGVASKVGSLLFNLVTVSILTIYFMLALPRMRLTTALIFSPSRRAQGERVIDRSIGKIGGYVAGNLITSAICAGTSLISLLLMGVPFAVPLAAWAGLADLIPQVGSYLGAVPAIIVAFFASPMLGVAVLVYFVLYQQFENYFLVPKVMKDAVDLSPAAVIISTLVAGSLQGFAGALLALPIAATIKVIIYDVWLENRKRQGDTLVKERLEEEAREEALERAQADARARRRRGLIGRISGRGRDEPPPSDEGRPDP